MNSPLFFIVRHGRTEGNKLGTYRGWSNGPDAQLNADGRDDVREAGLFLQRAGLSFPIILSDDLDRTQETAKILADILGIRVHETDKRLRPLNVGDFTGKSKIDHPLDEYMANEKLVIPGGESLQHFNARQQAVFDNILELIIKIHKPVLVVGHGSNVCYLHNYTNRGEKIGYEGLVDPGGVLAFFQQGIVPLTKKRGEGKNPFQDGTALTGYVTVEESRPPRSCWNCKWFTKDASGLGGCHNPIVRLDPQLVGQKQSDGTIAVGDDSCCNLFSNHVSS